MPAATSEELEAKAGGSDVGGFNGRERLRFDVGREQSEFREIFEIPVDPDKITRAGNVCHIPGGQGDGTRRDSLQSRQEFRPLGAGCAQDPDML